MRLGLADDSREIGRSIGAQIIVKYLDIFHDNKSYKT